MLGGGFKYFLCSPLCGEMIQFDQYFSHGLKPPTRLAGTQPPHLKRFALRKAACDIASVAVQARAAARLKARMIPPENDSPNLTDARSFHSWEKKNNTSYKNCV